MITLMRVGYWTKLLRSGDFKQTTGKLRTNKKSGSGNYGYCCLGVGAECSGQSVKGLGVPSQPFLLDLPDNMKQFDNDIKLTVRTPRGIINTTAVALNDEYKMSFAQIADIVEQSINRLTKKKIYNVKSQVYDIE